MLPDNFDELKMPLQTAVCIKAIIDWARSRDESAAILVLVPGEKEMEQIIAEWIVFSTKHQLPHCKISRVDSTTSQHDRRKVRDSLKEQNFDSRQQDSVVWATDVFGKSITLYINGVVDVGLMIGLDSNMFLRLYANSIAHSIQRKGRAGRVTETLFKKLTPRDVVPCEEAVYVMQRQRALSLVLAMVRLQRSFPIIGIPENLYLSCLSELLELGIITNCSASSSSTGEQYRCTTFGEDVVSHSVDVDVGVVAAVCARFDLPWHGRIAAAYVQTSREMFLRTSVANTCGLLPEQIDRGRRVGFDSQWAPGDEATSPKSNLITAVYIYLTSVAKDLCLDSKIFRSQWLLRWIIMMTSAFI